MRLYQENAKKLVGKKIDCHRRIFGYFPMTIIEIGGNDDGKQKNKLQRQCCGHPSLRI